MPSCATSHCTEILSRGKWRSVTQLQCAGAQIASVEGLRDGLITPALSRLRPSAGCPDGSRGHPAPFTAVLLRTWSAPPRLDALDTRRPRSRRRTYVPEHVYDQVSDHTSTSTVCSVLDGLVAPGIRRIAPRTYVRIRERDEQTLGGTPVLRTGVWGYRCTRVGLLPVQVFGYVCSTPTHQCAVTIVT